MTDKKQIKAIIKQYADKGKRLLEEAYENGEHASTTGYWDGYGDCANLLLRELDDMQEEPEFHKPKITLGEATCKLKIDDFTRALAECINQAQCAVVDPMAHAEIWKEELLELAKGKEPVSEDFKAALGKKVREAQDWTYIEEEGGECPLNEEFGADELEEFAKWGANWQKQQMEAYRIEHCKSLTNEQAELEENFVSSHVEKNNRIPTFIDAIEYGMEYCKQQMMKEAVDVTIAIPYQNGYGGYTQLVDSQEALPFGENIKVLVIKED